jgi:hypothetical protein
MSTNSPPALSSAPLFLGRTYEQLLDRNREWALTEGSLFFEGRGAVQETLKRITRRLEELGIPYAVGGGMALFLHGYRRFTEDVDLLVTREGLERIHAELDGRGYLRPFEGSKHLRDTDSKVKIKFLITGAFPGDGKPQSVSFPDPIQVSEIVNGIQVLTLPALITSKLASGLTGKGRARDLIDVGELIKTRRLPQSLADHLDPSVREEFLRLWRENYSTAERYLRLWKLPEPRPQVGDIEELLACCEDKGDDLQAMRDAGVMIDSRSKPESGYVYLVTHDPVVADRFDLHDEAEFWDPDADFTTQPGQ